MPKRTFKLNRGGVCRQEMSLRFTPSSIIQLQIKSFATFLQIDLKFIQFTNSFYHR